MTECDCLYHTGKAEGLSGWMVYLEKHGTPQWMQGAENKLRETQMTKYNKEAPLLKVCGYGTIQQYLAHAYNIAFTVMEIEESFGTDISVLQEDAKEIMHNIRKAWDLVPDESQTGKADAVNGEMEK